MKPENKMLTLNFDSYMSLINNIDDIVLSENPFEYLQEIPAFNMGGYLHISGLGDISSEFPKRLYHWNLPQAAIDEFEQAVTDRLPPCAKSCFLNQTFSWLTDIVKAPTTSETDKRILEGYLELTKEGFCVPLYGPHNSNGYVFIGLKKEKSAFSREVPYQILTVLQLMHTRFRQIAAERRSPTKLSQREVEVLELICLGKTNLEIAEILNISSFTVSSYVSRLFLKLGVFDRVSAAMRRQTMI